jgi:hypothetical protein
VNPKDEIQKLIQKELQKWADYDRKNEELHARQVIRFQHLRNLLDELIVSIEPEYIKATILDDHATIEVSHEDDNSSRMSWSIEPNYKTQERQKEYWRLNLWQHKVSLEEAPGFKVKEKQGEDSERTLEFGTEDEVILCLAPEIAKRVAFYRYAKKHLKP